MQGQRNDLPDTSVKNFWANVDIRGKDECWNWIHNRQTKGYPSCSGGKTHRVVYKMLNGSIPRYTDKGKKVTIRHICGNKRCCNPRHIRIGTASDNSYDTARKEGIKALTREQVLEARRLRLEGKTYASIARTFNITQPTAKHAVIGKGTYGEIV